MQVKSTINNLALPNDIEFYFATNTGHVFAKYKNADGVTMLIARKCYSSLSTIGKNKLNFM